MHRLAHGLESIPYSYINEVHIDIGLMLCLLGVSVSLALFLYTKHKSCLYVALIQSIVFALSV